MKHPTFNDKVEATKTESQVALGQSDDEGVADSRETPCLIAGLTLRDLLRQLAS